MSIPNRHRSPKSVRGRFPSTGVWLQVDTIEKILELTLADREHGRTFVRWPRDPERPRFKPLVKNAEPPSIEEQILSAVRRLPKNTNIAPLRELRPSFSVITPESLSNPHLRSIGSSPTNTSTPCGIIGRRLPCRPARARWRASRDRRQPRPEPGR